MRKIFILVIGLFCTQLFCQASISFAKKPYMEVDLVMENGQTVHGYLQDFNLPKFIESDFANNFKRIESVYHYDSKYFKFKSSENAKAQEIPMTDIKSIIVLEEDGSDRVKFDKMKLKTINSKYEIEDLDMTVMLPLQSEGKINLYGFSVSTFMGKTYIDSIFLPYLKKPADEYAYIPLDYDNIGLFNMGKIKGKFKKAFEEVTADCKQYQSHLDDAVEKLMDKKLMKEIYKEKAARKKAARKEIKNKDMELYVLQKIDNEYGIKPFIDLINEYGRICP